MSEDLNISDAWRRWRSGADLEEYDSRWDRLEADGHAVHDEAAFVTSCCEVHLRASLQDAGRSASVLDAGCGTGRVAAELVRRGLSVTGVDNDPDMLAYAARKPEPVIWRLGDLASINLDQRFDVIVMAGNILTFVEPSAREQTVVNLGRHLHDGGLLIMGSAESADCSFADVDGWCDGAGLQSIEEFGSWDRLPFDGGRYRVSVHRPA